MRTLDPGGVSRAGVDFGSLCAGDQRKQASPRLFNLVVACAMPK
jgi:hypothetical protein